jgi:RsiW-degrading membrane proteinase PrsW (M82 family)
MYLIGLALAPALAIILFVYFKDKYEKEPVKVLLISFLLGIVSIFPAIGLELLGSEIYTVVKGDWVSNAVYAFVIVGFSEEFCKYFFLRVYAYRREAFNEPYDGIVYAVMISMGFAAIENVGYVLQGGVEVGLLRMFTAVPGHAIWAVMMGYFVGLAKFRERSLGLLFTGLFTATFFHGLYDYFLFMDNIQGLFVISFISIIVGVILSIRAIKILNRKSPFKNGPIAPTQEPNPPDVPA